MFQLDDIASIRAFVRIAECGSFSIAAEKLHITQPAISKRIAALENAISDKLFDRIGKKILLTETGQTILPKCRAILYSIEDAEQSLQNLSGEVSGILRLGTSHHIGLHHLPPVIREFGQSYKSVELDLHFLSSEQVCQLVEKGELDLGIITLPPEIPEKLYAKTLWLDEMFAVTGWDHELAKVDKPTLETLTHHNVLLPDVNTYTHKIIDKLFSDNGLALKTSLSTNYLQTIKMMVSVGLGWSVLPRTIIDQDLKVMEIADFNVRRKLGYVQHARRTLPNAAIAMMGLLNKLSIQENIKNSV